MKRKIAIIAFILCTTLRAMDELSSMLVEQPPSLKFIVASKIATGNREIASQEMPTELLELIIQIRLLLSCYPFLHQDGSALFINLINDSAIDVDKHFSGLVNRLKRLRSKDYPGINVKQEILTNTLLSSLSSNSFRNYNIPLIKLVIYLGADVNAHDNKNDGNTPLISAVKKDYPEEIIQLLIESGADINAKNDKGITALISRVYANKKEIVKILVDANADVNNQDSNGCPVLIIAAKRGYKEIVKILLSSNIDINAKDENGYTALIWAVLRDQKEIVKMLLSDTRIF